MTEPTSTECAPSATFAPPPAMPSILASVLGETREVAALTRRSLALLLTSV